MGNFFSRKTIFSSIFGTIATHGYLFKKPSIKNFADVDFGKLCFRPEDQHSRYMVVARQDKTGKRHQILYDEKFIKILNEAEQRKSIESESELEDLHAISDEEAEDQRWEEWMKDKRIKSSSI